MDSGYQWIPFYEELADKLLAFKDKRNELFDLMKKLSSEQPLMKYLHFEQEDLWGPRQNQIDPFTVIGAMNRGASDKNRAILGKVLADAFDIKTPVPTEFAGIPVLSSFSSIISGNDELWDLFVLTMQATNNYEFPPEFNKAFEKAIAVSGNGLGKITMALYWVRPYLFMPLDSRSRPYLYDKYGIKIPNKDLNGKDYINFLINLKKAIDIKSPGVSFPEVSFSAWKERDAKTPNKNDDPPKDPKDKEGLSEEKPILENKVSAKKNIILYGAPGTGKTYSSIQYAVAIIEGKLIEEVKIEGYEAVFKRYLKYKDDGLIAFTTFHQSFSYEEFIEGIRPVVLSEEKSESAGEIEYEVHDGIFKAFCDKAGTPVRNGTSVDLGLGKNPTVWKVSLEGTGDNPTRSECKHIGVRPTQLTESYLFWWSIFPLPTVASCIL